MAYDYNKLLGKIVEKYGTRAKFAEEMQLSDRSISLKLNGKVGWRQDEILRAAKVLGIPNKEIHSYFFTPRVQDIEPL